MESGEEALDILIDAGFDVTIRKAKDTYRVECHEYNYPDEHRAVYGLGESWQEAACDAAIQLRKDV